MRKNKTPNYLYFIVLIIVIIIGLLLALAIFTPLPEAVSSSTISSEINLPDNNIISKNFISYVEDIQPKITADSPIWGNNNEPIIIFQYVDFGCDYSHDIQTEINQLLDLYPNKIKLVWKDLPTSYSQLAHRAARCAQKQNKFWEYVDLVWQTQDDFSQAKLITLANQLNLDQNLFVTCLADQSIIDMIKQDMTEADELEIYGTPHLYINDQELVGLVSLEDLQRIVDSELNKNNE